MKRALFILAVDDNPTNLKLAGDILESAGFSVLRAGDTKEARRIMEQITPDMILVDIQMPGEDGLEFTRRLRAVPLYRDLRIVAMTALAMPGDREKALAAGCDGYIVKPIDTRRLPAQLREIFDLPRERSSVEDGAAQ